MEGEKPSNFARRPLMAGLKSVGREWSMTFPMSTFVALFARVWEMRIRRDGETVIRGDRSR